MQRIPTTLATLALAAVAGVITAGTAAAESLSGGSLTGGRGGSSLGNGNLGSGNAANNFGPRPYNGDTTGAHHTDPQGFHHFDSNPALRNEHLANRRESQRTPQPEASRSMGNDGSRSTWTAVPNEDGTGWAVCKPQAVSC
ncbi:hypothetical protein [Nocardia yamanashiensis]|uniref:hypothetical protein n=1 Tax=Nocardia yamanashiensis TaxID=209247 RepID=UPI00082F2155|nr:hypothetical protein [Nocardia yamanashiensis]